MLTCHKLLDACLDIAPKPSGSCAQFSLMCFRSQRFRLQPLPGHPHAFSRPYTVCASWSCHWMGNTWKFPRVNTWSGGGLTPTSAALSTLQCLGSMKVTLCENDSINYIGLREADRDEGWEFTLNKPKCCWLPKCPVCCVHLVGGLPDIYTVLSLSLDHAAQVAYFCLCACFFFRTYDKSTLPHSKSTEGAIWPPKWGCFSNVPRVSVPPLATTRLDIIWWAL